MSEDLLRLADVGREVGLSRQRISKLKQEGRIKTVERFGQPMVTRKEFNRFKTILRTNGRPRNGDKPKSGQKGKK